MSSPTIWAPPRSRYALFTLTVLLAGCGEAPSTPTGRVLDALLGEDYELDAPVPGNREHGAQVLAAAASTGDEALAVYASELSLFQADGTYLATRFTSRSFTPPREVPPVRRLEPAPEGYVGIAPNALYDFTTPLPPALLTELGALAHAPPDTLVARFTDAEGGWLEDVSLPAPGFVCTAIDTNNGDDCPGRIACNATGACMAVWRAGSDLHAAGFRRGQGAAAPVLLSTGDASPAVTAGPAGFALVYTTTAGGERNLRFQRVTEDGAPSGAAVSLVQGSHAPPAIAATADGFVVGWTMPAPGTDPQGRWQSVQHVLTFLDGSGKPQRDPAVIAATRENSGEWASVARLLPLGGALLFNPIGDYPYLVDADGSATPLVDIAAGAQVVTMGDELVASLRTMGGASDSDVVVRLHDASGTALGGLALLSASDNSQVSVRGVSAPGASAVVWSDNRNEAPGVYRVRLDDEGCPTGPAHLLWASDALPGSDVAALASDGRTLLAILRETAPTDEALPLSAVLFDRDVPELRAQVAVPYIQHLVPFVSTGGYWLVSHDELWTLDSSGKISQRPRRATEGSLWGRPVASETRAEAIELSVEMLPIDGSPVPFFVWSCDLPIDESAMPIAVRVQVVDFDGKEVSAPIELEIASADCDHLPLLAAEGDGYIASWPGPEGRRIVRLRPDGSPQGTPAIVPELADAVEVAAIPRGFAWLTRASSGAEVTLVTTDRDFRVLETEPVAPPGYRQATLLPVGDNAVVVTERMVRWPARIRVSGMRLDGGTCESPRLDGGVIGGDAGASRAGAEPRGGCSCRVHGSVSGHGAWTLLAVLAVRLRRRARGSRPAVHRRSGRRHANTGIEPPLERTLTDEPI